jgi:hypothetical protein
LIAIAIPQKSDKQRRRSGRFLLICQGIRAKAGDRDSEGPLSVFRQRAALIGPDIIDVPFAVHRQDCVPA